MASRYIDFLVHIWTRDEETKANPVEARLSDGEAVADSFRAIQDISCWWP